MRVIVVALAASTLAATAACKRSAPPPAKDEAPPTAPAPTAPPAFGATPASAFADASPEGNASIYDQARAYEANGQLWLARLVLEKKALGDDGSKREIELLSKICTAQRDAACIDQCSARLGRKTSPDAGVARRHGRSPFDNSRE